MSDKRMEITRAPNGGEQTLGFLGVYQGNDKLFECKTLELPWKDNRSRVSCVPAGTYKVTKYDSPSKGRVFLLHGVPGRSYIEIHVGNFNTDILGCILVGGDFMDINYDGLKDVINSTATLNKLMEIMPGEFSLTIWNPGKC